MPALLLRLALPALVACGAPEPPAPPPPPPPVEPPLDAPYVAPDAPPPAAGRFDATEVRVAWKGAPMAPPTVTRDEAEALRTARALRAEALAGRDLADLARAASDAPSGRRDGRIGTFEAGTFDPTLEAAIASVAPGELAPLVRTAAGYHVLRREPVDEVRVAWAVWAWKGARGARVGRTKADAEAAALDAVTRLRGGEALPSLKADLTSPVQGELLGRAQWSTLPEVAAFALKPGEVAGPIELPTGFLVIVGR